MSVASSFHPLSQCECWGFISGGLSWVGPDSSAQMLSVLDDLPLYCPQKVIFLPQGNWSFQNLAANLDCALFTDVTIPESAEAYVKLTEKAIQSTTGRRPSWSQPASTVTNLLSQHILLSLTQLWIHAWIDRTFFSLSLSLSLLKNKSITLLINTKNKASKTKCRDQSDCKW